MVVLFNAKKTSYKMMVNTNFFFHSSKFSRFLHIFRPPGIQFDMHFYNSLPLNCATFQVVLIVFSLIQSFQSINISFTHAITQIKIGLMTIRLPSQIYCCYFSFSFHWFGVADERIARKRTVFRTNKFRRARCTTTNYKPSVPTWFTFNQIRTKQIQYIRLSQI